MKLILFVEDNVTNRDGLVRLLQKRGYKVMVAGDGATAVSMAMELRPDLILMDISLPVLDGFASTRLIRASEKRSSRKAIPIIALTAHAMAEDRTSAEAAGCSDFETKPVNLQQLFSKISSYLAVST
ncbi:MAG: response regulator [Verrucomicrobiota bacterium]